jgi:type III pantothenate kinase
MKPDLVADVGNSRIKWGRCLGAAVTDAASLSPDDDTAWQYQIYMWCGKKPTTWVVTGVHPGRRDRFADWVRRRGDDCFVLDDWQALPLRVLLDRPDQVGIDRLLDAVAARAQIITEGRQQAAVIVDAGSAVTVDWLDADAVFRGGAIFPGLRLMTQALHDYTALLPRVEIRNPNPPVPGTSTPAAIEAGVLWAVAGGVNALVDQLTSLGPRRVFLTGGDSALLQPSLAHESELWPHMTLEGIRLTAEMLP